MQRLKIEGSEQTASDRTLSNSSSRLSKGQEIENAPQMLRDRNN